MPKLEFDPKMSLGNVVTIAIVLIGAITAWNTVVNRQPQLAEKIAIMEASIAAKSNNRDQQMTAHEARIRAVEIAQAAQSSDLRAIQGGIARIEAQLERLSGKP